MLRLRNCIGLFFLENSAMEKMNAGNTLGQGHVKCCISVASPLRLPERRPHTTNIKDTQMLERIRFF